MPDQFPKIRRLRELIDAENPSCLLEVDGGIDTETASLAIQAGANVLVAGSAISEDKDRIGAMRCLRAG